jgi:hypothetical protein
LRLEIGHFVESCFVSKNFILLSGDLLVSNLKFFEVIREVFSLDLMEVVADHFDSKFFEDDVEQSWFDSYQNSVDLLFKTQNGLVRVGLIKFTKKLLLAHQK